MVEEWNVFTRQWDVCKQGSVINGQSASELLFQRTSQTLGDQLLKADADIASKPIGDVLKAFWQAVSHHTCGDWCPTIGTDDYAPGSG